MGNRLINEESPYLQQHAQNPVKWYPWGQEALQKAKKENKAIFLSIGYSSCHWCHVMEKESFENRQIAQKLNEHFVAIKVDKEERPDIDRHFQDVFQKMNNKAGGWPLSIFMTSDAIPFYSATYIPPIANYGMMGFEELLDVIAKSYQKDPKNLENKGKEVLNALKPKNRIEATKITEQLALIAAEQVKKVHDKEYGGFGKAPKFPHATTLTLAMNLYRLNQDSELKTIVTHTLDSMLLGGMYDIVDGGFCRYSTDAMWLVPHFEKMTYDNALMADVLLNAYRLTKQKHYKKAAIETIEFMLRFMSQEHLFFSASDADSHGIEGGYFLYDYKETKEAFEKNSISTDLLYDLGITKNGNFDGKSIPRLSDTTLKDNKEMQKAIEVLSQIRKTREYPFIDKKIITSWNAMMIATLFNASRVEPNYLKKALFSLEALEDLMLDDVTLHHSVLFGNKPKVAGFLEDYAWLTYAYICAYNTTLDELFLIKASNLANEAIRRYYKRGRWLIGDGEFQNFDQDFDTTYTSSVSLMVENLLTLRSLVELSYDKFIDQSLQVFSYNLMRQPISRPTMTNTALRYIKDDTIIKSSQQNLKELVNYNFRYPYTLLKVVKSESFEACSNRACFASAQTAQELLLKI